MRISDGSSIPNDPRVVTVDATRVVADDQLVVSDDHSRIGRVSGARQDGENPQPLRLDG
jgi:hypothetical protein